MSAADWLTSPAVTEALARIKEENAMLETEITVIQSTDERPQPKERPDPDWVRGKCPLCGEDVVSNAYYVGGRGYILLHECWASLGENPTCDYRRVL